MFFVKFVSVFLRQLHLSARFSYRTLFRSPLVFKASFFSASSLLKSVHLALLYVLEVDFVVFSFNQPILLQSKSQYYGVGKISFFAITASFCVHNLRFSHFIEKGYGKF